MDVKQLKENSKNLESVKTPNKTSIINTTENSLAILKYGYVESRINEGMVALTFKLENFGNDYTILPDVVKIEGVEYSDNGLYNDYVPGDGIYTRVESINLTDRII